MATQFSDLFNEFLQTEVNSLELSSKSPPQLSNYLSLLLRRSREEVYNLIYENSPLATPINKMDDCIEFYSQEYDYIFTSTIGNTTFSQVLNPIPTATNSSFYITVNNIQTANYTFNSTNGTITISNLPIQNNSIDIICYQNGQFNQTLSLVEQGILVDWMGVYFLKDKLKTQRLYNLAINGSADFKVANQANHIRSLQAMFDTDRGNATTKTLEYSYRNASDKTKFGGRGGIGGVTY